MRPPTRVHVQVNDGALTAAEFFEDRVRAMAAEAVGDGIALSYGTTPRDFEAALPEAEVMLLNGRQDISDLPRRGPHLRWLGLTSAGVEWVLEAGLPPGVTLTNASGTHIPKAAEFALTAVLMLNNLLPRMMTAQRAHRWQPVSAGTVQGKTALVLGMGALGGAAADALARQGMRVIGNSHGGRPHPAVAVMTQGDGFRAHLAETDFLVIALPLTPATHGLVDRGVLDRLPAHAGVVNIGRGEILDVVALAAKLTDGTLGGAVLDTVPQEPLPADSPLWDTPNLVITPHSGLYDPTAYGTRCLRLFSDNLVRFRAGEPLHQVVDRARGY